jgi:hypothetical protein
MTPNGSGAGFLWHYKTTVKSLCRGEGDEAAEIKIFIVNAKKSFYRFLIK